MRVAVQRIVEAAVRVGGQVIARIGAGCGGLLLAILVAAPPASGQVRHTLVLATATAGGGFEVYGAAVAKTLAEIDPGLVLVTRSTAGSEENLALLASEQVDLALVQGEAAHEALGSSSGGLPGLRVVAAMYPTAGMFVVRADSPYRSIADLKGQKIAFGARGSGLVKLARYVLEGIDLDIDRDFVPLLLERAGDGPALLRDGRVAALWGGGSGWPVFQAVMAGPGGGRLIAPNAEQIERIRARFPFLRSQTLAANSYPGQTRSVESVGSWSLILSTAQLSDAAVYRFCRALHLGQTRLAQRLPQASDTSLENTAAVVQPRALLHPAARTYLEEQGVLR